MSPQCSDRHRADDHNDGNYDDDEDERMVIFHSNKFGTTPTTIQSTSTLNWIGGGKINLSLVHFNSDSALLFNWSYRLWIEEVVQQRHGGVVLISGWRSWNLYMFAPLSSLRYDILSITAHVHCRSQNGNEH